MFFFFIKISLLNQNARNYYSLYLQNNLDKIFTVVINIFSLLSLILLNIKLYMFYILII